MEEENLNTATQEQHKNTVEGVKNEENTEGRTFTQDEVNRIVKQRLERSKKELNENQEKEFIEKQKELEQRENKLNCMEYIQDRGYPKEFLEAIDTSNVEEFKKKADMLNDVGVGKHKAPPLAAEPHFGIGTGMKKAFERQPHTPKAY